MINTVNGRRLQLQKFNNNDKIYDSDKFMLEDEIEGIARTNNIKKKLKVGTIVDNLSLF